MRPFSLRYSRRSTSAGALSFVLLSSAAPAQQSPKTPGPNPSEEAPVVQVEDETTPESTEAPEAASEPDERSDPEAPESPSSPALVPRPEPTGRGEEREVPPPAPETEQTPEEGSREEELPLKARLDPPEPQPQRKPSHLPPPALRPEEAHAPRKPAPRTEVMPGDFVARPITLPQGTFKMEFGQALVLWDAPADSALAPVFALGITERLEIGVDAPLHYDPGIDGWAALHPRPHVGVTWTDQDDYEIGTRVRALIPARPSIEPSLAVSVPVLWRLSSVARLDIVPEFHTGLGDDRALVARLGAQGTWQLSPSVFAGLGGTAQIGFLDSRDSGFDPEVLLGFTHQNYGRSFVDFVTRVFAQGIGGAEAGQVSKGAGFAVALTFYPELY